MGAPQHWNINGCMKSSSWIYKVSDISVKSTFWNMSGQPIKTYPLARPARPERTWLTYSQQLVWQGCSP